MSTPTRSTRGGALSTRRPGAKLAQARRPASLPTKRGQAPSSRLSRPPFPFMYRGVRRSPGYAIVSRPRRAPCTLTSSSGEVSTPNRVDRAAVLPLSAGSARKTREPGAPQYNKKGPGFLFEVEPALSKKTRDWEGSPSRAPYGAPGEPPRGLRGLRQAIYAPRLSLSPSSHTTVLRVSGTGVWCESVGRATRLLRGPGQRSPKRRPH